MPRKRLNILVAGGFDPNAPAALDRSPDQITAYARCLGEQIVKQGHNLLTGCQTELDKPVAEASDQSLAAQGCADSERRQDHDVEFRDCDGLECETGGLGG